MEISKKLITLSFACTLAMTALFLAPKKTWACYGASCKGMDPDTAGCTADQKYIGTIARAWSISHPTHNLANVMVMYSKLCNAKWARIDTWIDNTSVNIDLGYTTGSFSGTSGLSGRLSGYEFHTHMEDGSGSFRACGNAVTFPPFVAEDDPTAPPFKSEHSGSACTNYY